MHKPPINLVWFKRDLRIEDHPPLVAAANGGLPVLLCFFFEPSYMAVPESDVRHWRFQYEAVQELANRLEKYRLPLYVFHSEVIPVFEQLAEHFHIRHIYAHQEVNLGLTFSRDKAVKSFCKQRDIVWQEFPTDGIVRGLKHREGWQQYFHGYIWQPLAQPTMGKLRGVSLPRELYERLRGKPLPETITTPQSGFQRGGSSWANKYLQTFVDDRARNYNRHISKPELSRKSCSRLSPYLAFGNISVRQVFQAAEAAKSQRQFGRVFDNFQSRLWWRSHYIQKFESDCRMEREHLNIGFDGLEKPYDEARFKLGRRGRRATRWWMPVCAA